MGIFRNSRYTETVMYQRDDKVIFKLRKRFEYSMIDAKIHMLTEGETLDGLAHQYYGDSQLWWVLLEANPKYRVEIEIKPGDELIIPSYKEVIP